jgi:bifunctional non-homologous end joining protein LigD
MALTKYHEKRNFDITPEPKGANKSPRSKTLAFVVQKHQATRLHYDFRLEWNGVLLSWAIPKGPSLDPSVKRLAVAVEDHPLEYGTFEGVIPQGQYGGGTVMLWDAGTWTPEIPDVDAALRQGEIKFTLHGSKLKGSWVLVRTKGLGTSAKTSWLLIKHKDRYASANDVVTAKPRSIKSRRWMRQIAAASGGDVERAARTDPETAS